MSAATEDTATEAKQFPPVESLPTEWTDARAGVVKIASLGAVGVAAIALWAMRQPWIGLFIGGSPATEGQQIAHADGTTQQVTATGVISAWDAVHMDEYLARQGVEPMSVAETTAPGAPAIDAIAGMPASTTLVLMSLGLVLAGLLFRNTAGFIAGAFPLQMASAASAQLVSALTYGGDPRMFTTLDGAVWHDRAVMCAWALLIAGGLFVFSINRKQRALERAQFEAGLRRSPSRLTVVHMVASILVRGSLERATEVTANDKMS